MDSELTPNEVREQENLEALEETDEVEVGVEEHEAEADETREDEEDDAAEEEREFDASNEDLNKVACETCSGTGSLEGGTDEEPGDGDADDFMCPDCKGTGNQDATTHNDGGGEMEPARSATATDGTDGTQTIEVTITTDTTQLEAGLEHARAKVHELAEDLSLRSFQRAFGEFGKREIRKIALDKPEVRDSGAGAGVFTVRGHAAVFNKESLNLGYFTEYVLPGAFDRVLTESPDVRFLWDHDTRWLLARTKNGTLDLNTDDIGLQYWARVAPVTYADDLRVLLDGGYIDQASFAFTVEKDLWEYDYDEETGMETCTRYIVEVGDLYDVTVCAMGAYPQTDSEVLRSYIRNFANTHKAEAEAAASARARLKLRAAGARDEAAPINPTVARAKLQAKARRMKGL